MIASCLVCSKLESIILNLSSVKKRPTTEPTMVIDNITDEATSMLIDNEENSNADESDQTPAANAQSTKVYAKRWYILALFSLLGIYQV